MSLLHSFYCWGAVGYNFNFQPVFPDIRNKQLEMACCDMGYHSGCEHL